MKEDRKKPTKIAAKISKFEINAVQKIRKNDIEIYYNVIPEN